MKTFLISMYSLFLPLALLAQKDICSSSYMPLEEGITYELTNYDRKGNEESVSRQTVSELEETDEGYKATISFVLADSKGKEMNQGSFGIECRGNSIFMDMSNMLDQSALEGMGDVEVEMSGDGLEIPNNPSAGQSLPDGSIQMKTNTGAFGNFTMTLKVINRKVDGMETIETRAGTFDCVKISQETEVKSIVTTRSKSTTWYAKGIGMVKTESYNSKGKLMGTTVLTKLDRK